MPQAINLTVKDGATTPADKTFVLLSPAAGDGGVAEWALKDGLSSQEFPRFTSMATRTPKGRNLKIKLRVPVYYTDATTGLSVVTDHFEFNGTYSVPSKLLESQKNNCVAYAVNLPNHPMVREQIRDALSAT